jgi:hypothetical protein
VREIRCVGCGAELTNGLDTFGDDDAPMCWGCYGGFFDHPPRSLVEWIAGMERNEQNEQVERTERTQPERMF